MIELQNLGLNAITISAAINVLAMLIGSYGLWHQISLIWKNRSAQSVSAVWNIAYMAMFAAFVIYGYSLGSGALMIQVVRVVLLGIVVVGVARFAGLKRWHWLLLVAVITGLVVMSLASEKVLWFTTFSLLGGIAAADQPRQIWKNRTTGQVSYRLVVVYNIAAAAWIVYGISVGDHFVTAMGVLYVLINSTTMAMFRKYPTE